MFSEIFLILVGLISIIIASLILYARWNYGVLEGLGIPVEVPHWLLGNTYNFHDTCCHLEDLRRSRELGKIFGVYEGRTPVVYVADHEIIHKILFTDAHHFEKRSHDFGDPIVNESLEFLNGEKWKLIRNMLTPQFTTGKLKMQSSIVQKITNEHIQFLRAKGDSKGHLSKIDLHELMAPFAIEVIAEMMCGIKLDNAKDPNHPFVISMREALFDKIKYDKNFRWMLSYPFLEKLSPKASMQGINYLRQYLRDVLTARESSNVTTPDMVSVLVEMRRRCNTDPEYHRLGITEDSVMGQAFEFFIASYFGITIITKMLLYYFLENPKVHEKVLEEIQTVLAKFNGDVSYEALAQMEYLGACIQETMRISPGFFRPDRTCVKDWSHGGIRIKKGIHVTFPLFAIHHDPSIYPESMSFKPERFLSENKQEIPACSFLTFGHGSRQCIGIRLAYQMLKIFTVHLLKEFKMSKRLDTVWKAEKGNPLFLTLDPIYVDFQII